MTRVSRLLMLVMLLGLVPVRAAMAQATAEGVPQGHLLILEGARHLSLVERPELADLLRAHGAGEPVRVPDATSACCAADIATEEAHA